MTLGPIVMLCLVLLAVAVLMPGKKKPSDVQFAMPANPFHQATTQVSIRQQQADESAAAIAAAFKQADDAAWLAEQIERASAYFAKPKAT